VQYSEIAVMEAFELNEINEIWMKKDRRAMQVDLFI
jgi:hypothetical protein